MGKEKSKTTVMLYKYPGKINMYDGKSYDYIIVNDDEVGEYTKQGWAKTPELAVKKAEKPVKKD